MIVDLSDSETGVLIAGAGIGGLCLALALARHGIRSHVFERRDSFENEGAGIQIGPNGTRILAELGLDTALSDLAGKPRSIEARDGLSGETLARMPLEAISGLEPAAPYWTLHRADLHGVLLAAAQDNALIQLSVGCNVVTVESLSNGARITLGNCGQYKGALLVGADGLHSTLRDSHFDNTPLRAIGKSAARTVISAQHVPAGVDAADVGLWLAPSAHVVHYPVRSGEQIALVAIFPDQEVNTGWTAPVTRDWILACAGKLCPPLQNLLQTGEAWQKWSLLTRRPLRHWYNRRIVLLGDAAHPILPFLAQGAVMALEDASVLAGSLVGDPQNIDAALKSYEECRMPRTRRVARAAARNGRIYHVHGPAAWLRNQAMKSLGGQRLMKRYGWLYDWQAEST